MFHAVVEYGVQGKVMDYRSDTGHIRTNHKADYDSQNRLKAAFLEKRGQKHNRISSIKLSIGTSHLTECYLYCENF